MKRKTITVFIVISVIFTCLMCLSYLTARYRAEKTFKPFLEKELYYYGTRFTPATIYYDRKHKFEKWCGPSWCISYDHQTLMTSGPLSIRYDLFGRIIDTNPLNLLEEILPNYLERIKKE